MREIGVSFVDLLALYDHLFKARVSVLCAVYNRALVSLYSWSLQNYYRIA